MNVVGIFVQPAIKSVSDFSKPARNPSPFQTSVGPVRSPDLITLVTHF